MCSGSLRQRSCYVPQGAPLHCLFAGSHAIIANLWEVSDKDVDHFTKAILNSCTYDSILHNCNKCIGLAETSNARKSKFLSRRKVSKSAEIVEENCRFCEAKLKVASFISEAFISEARGACKLPTIIGSSVVCYGVPTILNRKQ